MNKQWKLHMKYLMKTLPLRKCDKMFAFLKNIAISINLKMKQNYDFLFAPNETLSYCSIQYDSRFFLILSFP